MNYKRPTYGIKTKDTRYKYALGGSDLTHKQIKEWSLQMVRKGGDKCLSLRIKLGD